MSSSLSWNNKSVWIIFFMPFNICINFSLFNFFFIYSLSSFVRLCSHDFVQFFTFRWYILVWSDLSSWKVSLLLRYENISFICRSVHAITNLDTSSWVLITFLDFMFLLWLAKRYNAFLQCFSSYRKLYFLSLDLTVLFP